MTRHCPVPNNGSHSIDCSRLPIALINGGSYHFSAINDLLRTIPARISKLTMRDIYRSLLREEHLLS